MSTTGPFVSFTVKLAKRLNPVTSGPAAPLKVSAGLDAFGPSLMPRKSLHQGVAAGLSVLAADAIGLAVDAAVRTVAPDGSPLAWRIGARAAVAAGGAAVGRIAESEDESTAMASLRSAGRLLSVAAIGGIIHEAGKEAGSKVETPIVPIVTGLGGFVYVARRWGKELETRKAVIQRWSDDDKPANLWASIGIGAAVANGGRLVGRGYLSSRRSLIEFFGEGAAHAAVGRLFNNALWAAGAVTAYGSLVRRLSKLNSKVESGYSSPPSNEYVSGGPNSISPFEELGLQGRRFVSEVVTPDAIERVMSEPAAAHPVRAFVGVESEPVYATGRSELALSEMERLGAFDRKYLLLVSPTGTGWVDHTMVECAELMARGDIATVCIQYGKAPSFLEIQGVSLGRAQFRQLLWGVKQRLAAVPEEKRPSVMVFGESLGAWSSSDVIMHQGIDGFDHYGITKALWFGLPGLARWSKTGMREGRNPLTPQGTVAAFDRFEQYLALSDDERERLRAIVLDHDNDPIAQMSLRLAVKRPPWLDGRRRGRNVPQSMQWTPVITFLQVLVDAMNAMVTVPGEFKSFGHDYRADTADFVHAGFGLPPVSSDQMEAIGTELIQMELNRANRIKGESSDTVDLDLLEGAAGNIQ